MSYEYMTGLGQTEEELKKFRHEQFVKRGDLIKKFGRATTSPGDICSPPEGGFVHKYHVNIPQVPAQVMEIIKKAGPMIEAGCIPTNRWFDIYKSEVCCPPGVDAKSIIGLFPLPAPAVVVEPEPEPEPEIVIPPDELEPEPEPEPEEPIVLPGAEDGPVLMTNGNGVPVINGNGIPVTNGNGVLVTNGNGAAVIPPVPIVINGAPVTNGNGVAVEEEKKYFGLTPMQLGIAAVVGAGALYFFVLKK